MMRRFGPLASGGGGSGVDPDFSKVISLLHFDGSFADQTGRTWTPYGGAATSTAKSKFGGASLPPGNQIIGGSAPIWEFYKAAFTIEFWLDRALSNAAGRIVDQWQSNLRFRLDIDDGIVYFRFYEVPGGLRVVSFPIAFVAGFRHYAICRGADGIFRGFDHGTPAVVTNPGPYTSGVYGHAGEAVVVGGVNGYLDDLRITGGEALYSGAFTPPTAAFPNS